MIRRRQIPFTAKTEGGENPTPVLQTPASPTWTGLYVGAFAGYKYSAVDHGLTLGGTFNQIPFVKGPLESRGSGELNNGGAELGGLLGFNYQMRHVVFGLEAARRLSLGAKVEQNTGPFVLGQEVPPLEVRTSLKTRYLVTLAPRFGIALHFLPYVTGGMAIGDLDFSQSIHDLADPASRIVGEKTQTNVGCNTPSVSTGVQECNINTLTSGTPTLMLAFLIVRIFVRAITPAWLSTTLISPSFTDSSLVGRPFGFDLGRVGSAHSAR